MKGIFQQSQLYQLMKHRNAYLMLASSLLVLSTLLTLLCFYLGKRERIILVPPTMTRSFWVGHHEASAEYLAEMTTFFAYLRLSITPSSADSQRQILLRYVDPSYFGALNALLIKERDHITTQHMSSAFYPVNVKANTQNSACIITGDLVTHVGKEVLATLRVTYQIQYRYDSGRLLVRQFQEVKKID